MLVRLLQRSLRGFQFAVGLGETCEQLLDLLFVLADLTIEPREIEPAPSAKIPLAWVPPVVMLPVEVTVTAPEPMPRASIPDALLPAVVILPVEVTVIGAAPMPAPSAKIAVEPVPAVVILPVEVTVTAPVPWARIPLA